MDENQRQYIHDSFIRFAEKLTSEQLLEFHFRIDDLIQYGRAAVFTANRAVNVMVERATDGI